MSIPGQDRVKRTAASVIAYPFSLRTTLMELFDIGPWVAITAVTFAGLVMVGAIVYFFRSAPPRSITISTGPEDSTYFKTAKRYAKILDRNGVKTNILTSKGSIENMERLIDPSSNVDLGFAQTGPAGGASDKVMSLGSVSYSPIMIYYRGKPIERLSELKGKRIAIGPIGSGTRNVALALLGANGVKPGETTALLDLDAEDAQEGLKSKTVDAAFVMGESASVDVLKSLMRNPDIHLYSFKQAAGYARKFEYLNVLELPEGTIDLGQNIPSRDISLLAPTVELIAVRDLHPALIDLVVEAAMEVHARPGFYQKRGEFPMAVERSIKLSDEASMYYKSGKGYLYRNLPFWLASLLSRILLVFVPVLVILIPTLRAIPSFFRWIANLRIRKRYRDLLLLEKRFTLAPAAAEREALRREFSRIDEGVNKMKVRASFAEQFYALRGHIDYVRRMMERT